MPLTTQIEYDCGVKMLVTSEIKVIKFDEECGHRVLRGRSRFVLTSSHQTGVYCKIRGNRSKRSARILVNCSSTARTETLN